MLQLCKESIYNFICFILLYLYIDLYIYFILPECFFVIYFIFPYNLIVPSIYNV